ncbi:uncharacterized protein BDR25DRAFT_244501, partial [Lindgomyces ingoldianus]
HRPLYINAILIQSCRRAVDNLCSACYSAVLGPQLFLECRCAKRHFSRACSNYK